MKLEEYQTAKTALEAGAALAPGDLRFTRLIKECDERIAGRFLTKDLSMRVISTSYKKIPATLYI